MFPLLAMLVIGNCDNITYHKIKIRQYWLITFSYLVNSVTIMLVFCSSSSGHNEGLYIRILYNIVSSHSRAGTISWLKTRLQYIYLFLFIDKEMLGNRGVYYLSCSLFMQEQTIVQNFRSKNHQKDALRLYVWWWYENLGSLVRNYIRNITVE